MEVVAGEEATMAIHMAAIIAMAIDLITITIAMDMDQVMWSTSK